MSATLESAATNAATTAGGAAATSAAAASAGVDNSPAVPDTCKTVGKVTVDSPIMTARGVNVHYGDKHSIKEVSIDIGRNQVVAMIGPRAAASRPSCAA